MLLFTQHQIDGHTIYDQVTCAASVGCLTLSNFIPRLVTSILRSAYVGFVFPGVLTANPAWMCWALPLSWLRQPLPIYPMLSDQVHYGSFLIVLATAIVLNDLYDECLVADQPLVSPRFLRVATRDYSFGGVSVTLPNVTGLWSLLAAGAGLIVWGRPGSMLQVLWPVRLLMFGWIVGHLCFAPDVEIIAGHEAIAGRCILLQPRSVRV